MMKKLMKSIKLLKIKPKIINIHTQTDRQETNNLFGMISEVPLILRTSYLFLTKFWHELVIYSINQIFEKWVFFNLQIWAGNDVGLRFMFNSFQML